MTDGCEVGCDGRGELLLRGVRHGVMLVLGEGRVEVERVRHGFGPPIFECLE